MLDNHQIMQPNHESGFLELNGIIKLNGIPH